MVSLVDVVFEMSMCTYIVRWVSCGCVSHICGGVRVLCECEYEGLHFGHN